MRAWPLRSSSLKVFGLTEWWGGGFEVVVFHGDQLAKLGPICWLYWECLEITPNNFSLTLNSSIMYQYYVDDTAMFWIDADAEDAEGAKLHAVLPPFQTSDPTMLRPTTFDTDIVMNLMRLTMLDGSRACGGNVDSF